MSWSPGDSVTTHEQLESFLVYNRGADRVDNYNPLNPSGGGAIPSEHITDHGGSGEVFDTLLLVDESFNTNPYVDDYIGDGHYLESYLILNETENPPYSGTSAFVGTSNYNAGVDWLNDEPQANSRGEFSLGDRYIAEFEDSEAPGDNMVMVGNVDANVPPNTTYRTATHHGPSGDRTSLYIGPGRITQPATPAIEVEEDGTNSMNVVLSTKNPQTVAGVTLEYRIYRGTSAAFSEASLWKSGSISSDNEVIEFLDTDLSAGTEYYYHAFIVNPNSDYEVGAGKMAGYMRETITGYPESYMVMDSGETVGFLGIWVCHGENDWKLHPFWVKKQQGGWAICPLYARHVQEWNRHG